MVVSVSYVETDFTGWDGNFHYTNGVKDARVAYSCGEFWYADLLDLDNGFFIQHGGPERESKVGYDQARVNAIANAEAALAAQAQKNEE
jgi:hypothetical protein